MKIELKSFQEIAARRLLKHVQRARVDAADDGDSQAIVLSSPTGSGKTVTITALMEWIVKGREDMSGDPKATFLWVSDSPELNAQSRDKILRQSSVFKPSMLVTVEPPFSQKIFEAGKIYFLNTQKLGKDTLLTKPGDGRDYSIWQTIENTSAAKPGSFYVILDEAHRGMSENLREREQATSIVQRFIKGYPEGGLQPVKLILGMSATPERFNKLIRGQGMNFIHRPYDISSDDVRDSGLLKDKIIISYPGEDQPSDWTLLEAAVRRWKKFCEEWAIYCEAQNMERTVRPVLVIQVEDGTKAKLTQTDLDKLVEVVERVAGRLPSGAWAHAFQEQNDISYGGQYISKIEASKIEDAPHVQVVLFKMSLTTGWDCPRAEVMMSFRKAKDHTLIAQLVGRMVRTPLARSVEGQEFLNTVSLFLPHYDENGLHSILKKLQAPDPETGLAVDIEDASQIVTLRRAPGTEEIFDRLQKIPSYRIERLEKSSNVRRLMKLSRQLTIMDAIDMDAFPQAKALVIDVLNEELKRLRQKSNFTGYVKANQEIAVREVAVEYGEWKELPEPKTTTVPATSENIQDLFSWCERQLGEGLHMEFWRSHYMNDRNRPDRPKLELFAVLQERQTWNRLEDACQNRLQELYRANKEKIEKLPTSRQEEYRRIRRQAKEPEAETLFFPAEIDSKIEVSTWDKHIYIDERGKYTAKLNNWEMAVLNEELKNPDVIGWLRNLPRKQWALCIPYEMRGDDIPMYPDMLIFRRENGKILIDILDPHDITRLDAVYKANGLAKYARAHGGEFGRIELAAQVEGDLKRLDVTNEKIRNKVLRVTDPPHLDEVFQEYGT